MSDVQDSKLPSQAVGSSSKQVVECKRKLAITRCTAIFAPGADNEQLVVDYTIESMNDATPRIVITDHANTALHTTDLQSPESGRLTWDGRDTNGALVTPLQSPFKVRLYNTSKDTETDQATFRVEYHSVALVMGHWAPADGWDASTAAPNAQNDQPRWIRFKLNHLGYYGGPLAGNFNDYDRNAVIRYRANHATLQYRNNALLWKHADFPATGADFSNEADADAYRTALTNNDNPRPYFTRPGENARAQLATGDPLRLEDGSAKLRIHVECLPWMANANWNELGDQYTNPQQQSRAVLEAARLNRPLIPLEAIVYLKGSDGQKKLTPGAVGAARVNWSFTEPQEDLAGQFADDATTYSVPRSYIELALKKKSGRTDANVGNNCHVDYGGIRTTDGSNYGAPFVVGNEYAPYQSQQGPPVYTTAYVGNVARCLGKAGVFFRPSYIAGDAYRVKAAIDMTNVRAVEAPTACESSVIEIWRDAKVAVVLGWPVRNDLTQEVWEKVRDEYSKAWIDLDVSAVAGQQMTAVTAFLQNGDYQAFHQAHLSAQAQYFTNNLSGDGFLTVAQNVAQEELSVRTVMASSEAALDDIWLRIATRVRATHPSGAIILAYRITSVDFQEGSDVSMSMPGFGVMLNCLTRGKTYYVVAHELAHCLFLNHGIVTARTSAMKNDHDRTDQNCMMDYASANAQQPWMHRAINTYAPHFCGRCNLKLRGWNIVATNDPLPAQTAMVTSCGWSAPRAPLAVGRNAKAVVAAVIKTRYVPDKTKATVTLSDGRRKALTTIDAQVLKGVVCKGDESPIQFQDPKLIKPWTDKYYHLKVDITVHDSPITASTSAPLAIFLESVIFHDAADARGLYSDVEVTAVSKAIEALNPSGVRVESFKGNANIDKWAAAVGDCWIYHHISHGGVLCTSHKKRADVTELLPKYPAWCQADPKTLKSIQEGALELYSQQKDCTPAFKQYIQPKDKTHPMVGVMQWVVDPNNSSKDIMFSAADIAKKLKSGPQMLAFLSCCVLGWEKSMAETFIKLGTPYVIAFRCAYNGRQAADFASEFYAQWLNRNLDPERLESAFLNAAVKYPEPEPVLFSQEKIVRFAVDRPILCKWDDEKNFLTPMLAPKYLGK